MGGAYLAWRSRPFYRVKRLIPRRMQLAMARLVRRQGSPAFPAWPFEPAGGLLIKIALADRMLELGSAALHFPWFWPEGRTAAATLTHDVESAAGLERVLTVAALEEGYGFGSSFNVVSDWYPINDRQLEDLAAAGHEIGSHAIHHDRSLFASRASFERQLPLLHQAAKRLGAVGFRSPADSPCGRVAG